MFNVKKLSFLLVSIGLAAAGGYLFMRFIDIKKQSEALKAQNIVLAEEKTILRQRLSKETKEKQENETAVVKLQNELSGLQDTKKIKDLYLADQEKLKTLTMANKKVREKKMK